MPILASLISNLIGVKPESENLKAQQRQTPVIPQTVQQAADIPPISDKPVPPQQPHHAGVVQQYQPPDEPRSVFSPRSLKQLSLFGAGAAFLFLSTTITRRAVARRILSASPRFYHPSHVGAMKQGNPDGPMIAAEALGLATLNVFSFGIMLTGGIAWAYDISTLEDLRTRARQKLYGEAGALDEDAEKQIEEWMAKVLSGMKKDEEDKIQKDLEKGKKN
ncbi:hypothetical protein DL546_007110 [Coniochaeta pulveracea]|uniref:Altered inheritance of mitochondria protein 11 n=1 Tax=Coniochaeta pulveracea TaxID=177199 RepID=A0A420YC41_9PEZI|nr:hypothetical protein DL546_007110 [Coniochaeta pulveracea]